MCGGAVSTPHSTGQPTVATVNAALPACHGRTRLTGHRNVPVATISGKLYYSTNFPANCTELRFLLEPRHISKLSVMPRWGCNVCKKCTDLYAYLSSLSGVPFDVIPVVHIEY